MFKTFLPTLLVAAGPVLAQGPQAQLDHVRLDLRLDWTQQQVAGHALLSLRTTEATQSVQLDAAKLQIRRITLAGRPLAFQYDGSAQDGALRIQLPRLHAAGELLQLRIDYRSQHVNESAPANIWGSTGLGLRWFKPTATDPRKRQQVWASGEPRSARYWFPGIDRPDSWHRSELIATVAAPLQVLAGGELLSRKRVAGGQRTHWRIDTPHRSQQLLFIVGEYAALPSAHASVQLASHGYPQEMDGVAASVPRLPDSIDFYSRLLAAPFPVASYRQVFVPDFPWGHAAPGLAMQSENMVDDAGTHADFLYLWNVLQAESAAQQWFGVRRGAASSRDLWLDRALPRQLGGFYSASRNGHDEFQLYTLQPDMDAARASAEPLELPPTASDAQLQSAHLAARGHAVLHMLRRQVGDAAWTTVLRRLAAGQGSLGREELLREVNAAAGRDMAWFFDQWMSRGGHPVFEVTQQLDGEQLQLQIRQSQSGGFYAGHLEVQIDGLPQRVWLQAQADNRFTLPVRRPPQGVQIDHDNGWLKELKQVKTTAELLAQFRTSLDAPSRLWAQQQLQQRAKDTPDQGPAIANALREAALRQDLPWRGRWQALLALRQLQPGAPDAAASAMLLRLVHEERSWLRAQGLHGLGDSRDAQYVPLYLQLLAEPSDRVVTAAAIALGKSGHPDAFAALQALPQRPSWKNQCLVAALNGLAQLKDPRGVPIALAALQDIRAARWTLATPVWDHRLAAADTLRLLGAGAQGLPLLQRQLQDALAQPHVNDSLYTLQLIVALGVPEAREALAQVRRRFQGRDGFEEALKPHEERIEALSAPAPR